WQLARRVALTATNDELFSLEKSLDQVTAAILDIAHALSENVVDPAGVRSFVETFVTLKNLPIGSNRGEYVAVIDMIDSIGSLPLILDLAEKFSREKVQRGFVEY